jgi:hypothetical protein
VPAVALLAEVLAAVEASTALPASSWRLSSAKFTAPVGPDTPVAILHQRDEAGGVRFEVRGPAGVVASGALARRPA